MGDRYLLALPLSLLIAIGAGLAVLRIGQLHLLSVQTGSMSPAILPGDAVLVKPPGQLKLGDVVSYHSPRNPRVTVTHRLVAIGPSGWLTTRGDNRSLKDPSFPPRLVEGRAVARLPKLGYVLDAIHNPAGLLLAVYLPALSLLASETRRLAAAYARPLYSARL